MYNETRCKFTLYTWYQLQVEWKATPRAADTVPVPLLDINGMISSYIIITDCHSIPIVKKKKRLLKFIKERTIMAAFSVLKSGSSAVTADLDFHNPI